MRKRSGLDADAKRSWGMLLGGVSALTLALAMPAYAQDADDADEETATESDDTIEVRGIRQSLENAQDIKQNADTFVDAVTSEDIGALPDRSVTEALQRIPGIQIDRFAGPNDPDHFSIEGQGVLVRGLTFVRSEFNGRDAFSANNGRALSFADVSPELLGSVQVFKNQTADLIEGGVAGVVNLVTRKPFDRDERVFAGTIEYNYADFREEGAPTFSALFSDVWETDLGKFGLLVNGVTSKLKTRSDGTQISSFQPRDGVDGVSGTAYIPEGAALRTQDYDRDRLGYGGSVQWESNDGAWLATAEFLRSEATTSWNEHVMEVATDNVGDAAFFFVPGTEYGFDGDNLFQFGTVSAPTGWKSDQGTPAEEGGRRTPIYGLQSNNIFRSVEQEYVTEDLSFNLKWTPNDRWAFNIDYQHVESTVDNVDFGIWGSTFQDVAINIPSNGDIPDVVILHPNEVPGFGGGNPSDINCVDNAPGTSSACPVYLDAPNDSLEDPFNSFWRSAMDHIEDSEGSENAFRADVSYDTADDFGWIQEVRAGGRYAKREQLIQSSQYDWGSLSEIWGGGGPIWFDEVGVPEGVVSNFTWDNFMRGKVSAPPAYPYMNINPAQNYNQVVAFADAVAAAWTANGGGPSWERLSERANALPGSTFTLGEVSDVTEETLAFYAMAKFGTDNLWDSGMTLDGNVGVRYVRTDFTAIGGTDFPAAGDVPIDTGLPQIDDPDHPDFPGGSNVCLPPIPDPNGEDPGEFNAQGFCALSEAERNAVKAFANGAGVASSASNDYSHFLPSVNLKLGLNEEMIVRFAYSKALSRASFGQLRNYFALSQSQGTTDPRTQLDVVPEDGFSNVWFGFIGAGGNPQLDPVTSDNFDLSFEWYFAPVGSLTVSAYYKRLYDIIVTGQGDIDFTNNGQTYTAFVRQPTNSDDVGTIRGFEIAYQQFYDFLPEPFDGLGVQATYTFIDSEGVQSSGVNGGDAGQADGSNLALVDLSDFPLQGLSKHNFNAAVIYEKGPISTRLAYSWRDEYLVTPRDVITPFYPVFQNASGQLDGSFFYSLNDNLKLGVQAANLTNEVTETTMLIPQSGDLQLKGPRSYFMNDRRFTASLRFNY